MEWRSSSRIARSMRALGGGAIGAIGASTTALFIGVFDPNWVASAGTWVGGTATVLPLLWATQAFHAGQASRDAALQRCEQKRVAAAAARKAMIRSMANTLILEPQDGDRYGHIRNHDSTIGRASAISKPTRPCTRSRHFLFRCVRNHARRGTELSASKEHQHNRKNSAINQYPLATGQIQSMTENATTR